MHAPDIHRDAPRVRKGGAQSMPQTWDAPGMHSGAKGVDKGQRCMPRRAGSYRIGIRKSNRNRIESLCFGIYNIESNRIGITDHIGTIRIEIKSESFESNRIGIMFLMVLDAIALQQGYCIKNHKNNDVPCCLMHFVRISQNIIVFCVF